MSTEEDVKGWIEASGAQAEPLPVRDRRRLLARWRSAFAAGVFERTGKRRHGGYDWHAFSYGFSPAETGPDVVARAARSSSGSYYVLSAWVGAAFGFRCRGPLSDPGSLRADIIVVGAEMQWTLVFTHESDCGPYFAMT